MAAMLSDLKRQVLLAALRLSEGDLNTTFTSEELLVEAWKEEPVTWGLRGFERKYPDSHRIDRELDSRGKHSKGLVEMGYLERVEPRVYRLTAGGLQSASRLLPQDVGLREKAHRELEARFGAILEHPTFRAWLKDPNMPKHFRDAGYFWSIAPGTPPNVIRKRIASVDDVVGWAAAFLEERGLNAVVKHRDQILFDRTDVARVGELQETLKRRFRKDLQMLGADLNEADITDWNVPSESSPARARKGVL